ncbi:MAG TPA: PAS domain S-box protein, partial [Candidatus Methylacidiphilales bacterium]|nr:PAS domain S-box protein [Candidatus Methylacidiphilales bacterium]
MKYGAADYLLKDRTARLPNAVERALREKQLRAERREVEKNAQQAAIGMRESEEFSRGVMNSVIAHIAVVDREGTIVAVNDAWRQFAIETIGDSPASPAQTDVGTNYLEVCKTSQGRSFPQAEIAYQGLLSVLRGEEEHFELEYNCQREKGKRWFLMSATPLKTKKGGATISHMEITERKQAEEQIEEQAAFLNKAQDAILARSLEGKILFWNQSAERLYGWKRHEVLGRHIGELLYPDLAKFEEINGWMLAKGEWSGELRHQTKNKNEIIVESRWTLIKDKEGNPKSMLEINTDITEKKKIEAQFLRAQRMESIGTLAGGIAHDLNNILTPIMMSIEVLKTKAADLQARKILETIGLSAKRGADIVRQVLSFARGIEGERIEIQPKHLLKDLEQIIKDTFPKEIRLEFAVSPNTWTILGDPTQMHQVLLNLCVNARDAMPGGGALHVDVENCVLDEQYAAMHLQARPGRYVKFSVTDAGVGIPPEILDKIFEPFFTTKDINKGTGLGLSTVSAIVKSHEGLINVYSEQGKGTTFHVYFPAMETSGEAKREQLEEANVPRGNGETILLIDDESSILTVTSQTLQAFGYRVITASDGAEALAIYAQYQQKIAIVLTDMRMPVLDGAAMIQALMRINPAIKIIAASGLDANNSVAKLPGSGVRHFLTKPYTAGTLLKTVRMVLDEE